MSDEWDFSGPGNSSPAQRGSGGFAEPDFGNASPNSREFGPGPDNPWSAGDRTSASLPTQARPPFAWLVAAGFVALVGLVMALLVFDGGTVYLIAWALAGPVAIGLLTVFVRRDTAQQSHIAYNFPSWRNAAYRGVLVLCLVAVVVAALRIGDWAGHL